MTLYTEDYGVLVAHGNNELRKTTRKTTGIIDTNSIYESMFNVMNSTMRLQVSGFLDNFPKDHINCELTDKGVELFKYLKKRFAELKHGIPIEDRGDYNPIRLVPETFWWTMKFKPQYKKVIPVRGTQSIMCYGDLSEEEHLVANTTNSTPEKMKKRTDLLKRIINPKDQHNWTEVSPFAYQVPRPASYELIWLRADDWSFKIAIQAKFYDYLMYHFPSGQWFIRDRLPKEFPGDLLQLRAKRICLGSHVAGICLAMSGVKNFPELEVK